MFAWTSPRMPRTGGWADRHGLAAARPRATGRFRRRRRIRPVMLGAAAITDAAERQVALAGRPPRLATRLGTGPHVPELGVTGGGRAAGRADPPWCEYGDGRWGRYEDHRACSA